MSAGSQLDALEDWLNEATRRCMAQGFLRGRFHELRTRVGTVAAINQQMGTPVEQTPLRRLKEAGLLEWSLEAGVLRFPECFDQGIRDAAKSRLDRVDQPSQSGGSAPAPQAGGKPDQGAQAAAPPRSQPSPRGQGPTRFGSRS